VKRGFKKTILNGGPPALTLSMEMSVDQAKERRKQEHQELNLSTQLHKIRSNTS
jgi:hypothetical protein